MRGTQLLRPSPARPAPHRVGFGSDVGTYVELHTDGVGLVAQRLWPPGTDAVHHRHGIAANVRLVVDEALVELVVAGLQLVCRHAVDHGDAGPDATAVCVLSDGGPRGHTGRGLAEPVVACRARQVHGLEPLPGTRPVEGPALRSTATVHPAEVAADRRALLQAAGRLANGLLQEFGWPELSQLTAEGGLRVEEFSPSTQPAVTRWATAAERT
jgi:hypothetical protein